MWAGLGALGAFRAPGRLAALLALGIARHGPTLAAVIGGAGLVWGRRLAAVDGARAASYRQLAAAMDRVAWVLERDGLAVPGTRAAAVLRSDIRFLPLVGGLLAAGADVSLVSPRLGEAALAEHLANRNVQLVVCDPDLMPEDRHAAGARWVSAADLLGRASEARAPWRPSRAWRSRLTLLTSGTTGTPKGVRQVRRAGQVWPALALAGQSGLQPGRPVLALPPLVHGHGLSLALYCLATGSPLVLPGQAAGDSAAAKGGAIWRALTRWRVRVVAGTPAHLRFLAAYLEAARPPPDGREAVAAVVSGSDMLDSATVRALTARWGVPVRDFYGTSQNSTLTTRARWGLPGEDGNVGRPVAGTGIMVADAAGRPVPLGVEGLVLARSALAGRPQSPFESPAAAATRRSRSGPRRRWGPQIHHARLG
ncbi:MAG: long-chain fatty acid--CoA ligase, partial [Bifidobacteriaceae bacterium]|nr:long-chain fatty acid--CoA ligase [Bifidobacteriaceae bacterium]